MLLGIFLDLISMVTNYLNDIYLLVLPKTLIAFIIQKGFIAVHSIAVNIPNHSLFIKTHINIIINR